MTKSHPTAEEKARLIELAKKGDPKALVRLALYLHPHFVKGARSVYNPVKGRADSGEEDALDAAQDAFVKIATKGVQSYTGSTAIETFAYHAGRYAALEQLKKTRRYGTPDAHGYTFVGLPKRALDDKDAVEDLEKSLLRIINPAQSKGMETADERIDRLEHERRVRLLNLTLNRLPVDRRRVITAHLFDGLQYQEIADKLKIPRGTVQSRYGRGIKELAGGYHELEAALAKADTGTGDAYLNPAEFHWDKESLLKTLERLEVERGHEFLAHANTHLHALPAEVLVDPYFIVLQRAKQEAEHYFGRYHKALNKMYARHSDAAKQSWRFDAKMHLTTEMRKLPERPLS